MNKHLLMLSAATVALMSGPAFATDPDYTNIVTQVTVPVKTSTAAAGAPGNITLNNTPTLGTIVVSSTNTTATPFPAIKIDSDNTVTVVTTTTISDKNTSQAVGILADLTTVSHTSGIVDAGTIDLTGSGNTKYGIWLNGLNTFNGSISMVDASGDIGTIKIQGDSSVGILQDTGSTLNGNLTIGSINVLPTSTSSLKVIGVDLGGTTSGNVTVTTGATVSVSGAASEGFISTGNIGGFFANFGTIGAASGTTVLVNTTGNPDAGSGVTIGGNVTGGFYNAGRANGTADLTATATIGTQSGLPALYITPQQGSGIATQTIGVYVGDLVDPGFSLLNRGTITAVPPNENESAAAMVVTGADAVYTTTLTGGIFNSGTINASSQNALLGSAVNPVAVTLGTAASSAGAYSTFIGVSDVYNQISAAHPFGVYQGPTGSPGDKAAGDQASFVNSSADGGGAIISSLTGVLGGQAIALKINSGTVMPSLINSGRISASAATSDTTITSLSAVAIVDISGTLTSIVNNGTIQAAATVLDNNAQVTQAINLVSGSLSTPSGSGVTITDQSTATQSAQIFGDILFGTGDNQIVNVLGAGPNEPASITGNIVYGLGSGDPSKIGSDELNIGASATVNGIVVAPNSVAVDVQTSGTLILKNSTVTLDATTFHIETAGKLSISVSESLLSSGVIDASTSAHLDAGALLGVGFASYIPAPTTANPNSGTFVLISAPTGQLNVHDLALYQSQLALTQPFLFKTETLAINTNVGGQDQLVLNVVPKSANDLLLTGYAAQLYPYANQALANDDILGSALIGGVTPTGTVGSTAYIASGNAKAQQAYDQFAPDVSGGARAIAISLTDQAAGPIAARQRMLRMYGKTPGEVTLWGQEFASTINDPGKVSTGQTGFKDRGFGFALGVDGGDPRMGWYGAAFTFYSGDVTEALPRDTHTDSLWYMLSAYTDWRGRGLFLDTKLDVGYIHFKERRMLDLANGSATFTDEADSKRAGLVGAIGATTGVVLAYGATTITPQISLDGMSMRQEGFTESHPLNSPGTGNGMGFNLTVAPYYASSLRTFLGADIREDLDLGDFFLQPEARFGYRYDFINSPVKLKTAFADIDPGGAVVQGPQFTVIGPDPAQGNLVAGASVATTTDAWTMGLSFDYIRGSNGAVQQVGTFNLLGRI